MLKKWWEMICEVWEWCLTNKQRWRDNGTRVSHHLSIIWQPKVWNLYKTPRNLSCYHFLVFHGREGTRMSVTTCYNALESEKYEVEAEILKFGVFWEKLGKFVLCAVQFTYAQRSSRVRNASSRCATEFRDAQHLQFFASWSCKNVFFSLTEGWAR